MACDLAERAEQQRDVDGVQRAEPRVGRGVVDAEAVHAPAGGCPLLRPALGGIVEEVRGDALDLLVICAEAGLTVDAAFNRVARELGKAYPELGDEFALTSIELGFLTDTRRMNVALTRARRFLLVVGDSATLGAHPYYQALVAAVDDLGAHGSAWADDGDPVTV